MNLRIAVRPRWFGPVPMVNGKPLPKSQWVRAGRRRKWSVPWFAPDGTRARKTFDLKEDAEAFARNLSPRLESTGSQARLLKLIEAARKLPHRALWWEAFLTLAYTSGARAGELTHVLWSDIDFKNDTVCICAKTDIDGVEAWRPKDYDRRVIPVPRLTIDVLARLHAEASEGSAFVFISRERATWIKSKREAGSWKTGRAIHNNLTRDMRSLVVAAGIPIATLHDLRRACITHWAWKLPAPVVQELAGHADIKTTLKHYVILRDEDMAAAREVSAAVLTPVRTGTSEPLDK